MSSGLQDLKQAPRFIAVEGPSVRLQDSLTKRLAETFNYELLLENAEENPFLDRFYPESKTACLGHAVVFPIPASSKSQKIATK